MNKRTAEERIFKVLMLSATILVALSLFLILGTIIWKGAPYLNWEMLTKVPDGGYYFGRSGGVLNAIVGSLLVAGGATLLAFVLGIPIALFLTIYLRRSGAFSKLARLSFDVLFGIPSIVYGAFAFSIMVYLGIRASLLGGILAVTLLVIPVMVRTLDELLSQVPGELKHAALSLGATRWEASLIFLKQIRPGIATALLLAFGRGVGDVAAVMFTAGFSDQVPYALDEPAATLPLAIFFQLSSPIPEVQGRAYASALVLTLMVILIVILTHFINRKR